MVLAADQVGELVHRLLYDVRAGQVIRIDALASLKEDIRVLGSASDDGMIGRHSALSVGTHQVVVNHGAYVLARQLLYLVDLMGCAKALKEVDERHPCFQGSGVCNHRHVLRLLDRIGSQQAKAGGAGSHHV